MAKSNKIKQADAEAPLSGTVVSKTDKNVEPKFRKKFLRATNIQYLLFAIVLIGVVYFFATGGFNRNTVNIGGTKITKKEVSSYASQLAAYEKAHPNETFSSNLSQYATDKLILNAALKVEAKKYNVTLSNDDIAAATDITFPNETQVNEYVNKMKSQSFSIALVSLENIAYENKLQNKLIKQENLTMITLVLDTPYFDSLPTGQVQAAYNTAKSRMANEFLPLVNSGTPETKIALKGDVQYTNAATPGVPDSEIARQLVLYNTQGVVAVSELDGYQQGITGFNDTNSTGWYRANIGNVYGTADKIDQLKKVGDSTGLFVSKAGTLSIFRLDSVNNGTYSSWSDLLNTYEKKYVHNKLQVAFSTLTNSALGLANKLVATITTPGLQQAWAANTNPNPNICGQSSHAYILTFVAWNTTPGFQGTISGVQLEQYRNAGDTYVFQGNTVTPYSCGSGPGDPAHPLYVTSSSNPSPNCSLVSNTLVCSGNTLQDNCYDTPPHFQITSPNPSGLTKDYSAWPYVNAGWEFSPIANANSFNPSNLKDGFPDPPPLNGNPTGDNIAPGISNGGQTYSVVALYKSACTGCTCNQSCTPTGTITGTCTFYDITGKDPNLPGGTDIGFQIINQGGQVYARGLVNANGTTGAPSPSFTNNTLYSLQVRDSANGGSFITVASFAPSCPPTNGGGSQGGNCIGYTVDFTGDTANREYVTITGITNIVVNGNPVSYQITNFLVKNSTKTTFGYNALPGAVVTITTDEQTWNNSTGTWAWGQDVNNSQAIPNCNPVNTTPTPWLGVNGAMCGQGITGWAAEPVTGGGSFIPGATLTIQIWADGPINVGTDIGSVATTGDYPATNPNFTLPIPYNFSYGSHSFFIYAIYTPPSGAQTITGPGMGGPIFGPDPVTLSPPCPPPSPWLGLNTATCLADTITGWAAEPQGYSGFVPGAVLQVSAYADGPAGSGTPITTVNTSGDYPGQNPNWSIPIPSNFRTGGHVFYIYASYTDAGVTSTTGYGVGGPIYGGNGDGTINLVVDCPYYTYNPSASVQSTNTSENPKNITFHITTNFQINSPSISCVNGVAVVYRAYWTHNGGTTYYAGSSGGPTQTTGCIGAGTFTYPPGFPPINPPPGSLSAGDQFCIDSVVINPGSGYVDASGNQIPGAQGPAAPPIPQSNCLTVVNEPYFKVYNSGVSAGGNTSPVTGSCNTSGIVAGWNNDTGLNPTLGAGAQFSTLAALGITGFASGQNSATSNGPPPTSYPGTGLALANSGVNISPNTTGSPAMGGFYGTLCSAGMKLPTSNINNINSNNITIPTTNGTYVYSPSAAARTAPLTITAGSIPDSTDVAIYVNNQDVYIAEGSSPGGGIVYSGAGGGWIWNQNNTTIPSFALVVTGGNIYIDHKLTQLDGLYVAQQGTLNAGGTIYTCALGTGSNNSITPTTDLYNLCNQQLTVNGSFVANQVNMMRTYGSLRDSITGVRPCSNGTNTADCAAEIFNYSPEMFLSSPALTPSSNGALQYNAYTNLPPVL